MDERLPHPCAQPEPPTPPTRGAGNHALAEGAGEFVAVMAAMALAHL
jgi:hypothetical protein